MCVTMNRDFQVLRHVSSPCHTLLSLLFSPFGSHVTMFCQGWLGALNWGFRRFELHLDVDLDWSQGISEEPNT